MKTWADDLLDDHKVGMAEDLETLAKPMACAAKVVRVRIALAWPNGAVLESGSGLVVASCSVGALRLTGTHALITRKMQTK